MPQQLRQILFNQSRREPDSQPSYKKEGEEEQHYEARVEAKTAGYSFFSIQSSCNNNKKKRADSLPRTMQ